VNSLQHSAVLISIFAIYKSSLKRNGRLSESRSNLVPSSILSIIGGALIIIGGFVPLGMLGMSGHYGMTTGTGGMMMMGGRFGGMMPLQSFIWTTMAVVSVISTGTGVVLIIGGYSIYGKPESAGKWSSNTGRICS
jgi:hypothetical protein